MSVVPDEGLQAERTALSWRRTALSLTAGSLIGTRLLSDSVGPLGISLGIVAGGLGFVGFTLAQKRYTAALVHLDTGHPPGRAPITTVTVAATLAACLGLVFILLPR